MKLALPDSGAVPDATGRITAASASRNAAPILALLQAVLPAEGRLLEIASGTGQHARAFAEGLPGWHWQPTDVTAERFASIRAWAEGQDRIAPPRLLDAARPGWAAEWGQWDAVLLVNLLHLIPDAAAGRVLEGIAAALAPQGKALIYGPFLRDGQTVSDGDARFHADLRAQDPAIGYKDQAWVTARLAALGCAVEWHEMPAHNLAAVIFRI